MQFTCFLILQVLLIYTVLFSELDFFNIILTSFLWHRLHIGGSIPFPYCYLLVIMNFTDCFLLLGNRKPLQHDVGFLIVHSICQSGNIYTLRFILIHKIHLLVAILSFLRNSISWVKQSDFKERHSTS